MDDNKPVVCKFCNGYYDFGSEQFVCSTCHAFIYEFYSTSMSEGVKDGQKEASNDSGNEEPERGSDLYASADWFDACESVGDISALHDADSPPPAHPPVIPPRFNLQPRVNGGSSSASSRPCPLRQQQQQRCLPSTHVSHHSIINTPVGKSSTRPSLDDLPTEILIHIFQLLDDISLWTLRRTSSRCRQVIDEDIPDQRWSEFVQLRWPLFTPRTRVTSWRQLYLNLMDSVTCRFCLERLRIPMLFPVEAPTLRYRRIVQEIKNLCTDPPFGICVLALDQDTYSHCLAGIDGPQQSPYQGGRFHVHILIPDSYPIRPPVIRFLTRILHPNISFHGDVGMDCIRHNWSLALTLEKLLISLQSLLTDPYTTICMEPVIGRLYTQDRPKFEELAKLWTWKYACHDYLSVDFVSSMALPNYLDDIEKPLSPL